jgi:hypothetical protein
MGDKCLNQQCAPPSQCNAQTCPFGCCDGQGNCQPGFAPFQCGNFGNQCANCTQFGQQCVNQQCGFINTCSFQTCQFGCCDAMGVCQPGFSPTQCGNFGNVCQNCLLFGDTCSGQQCVFQPDGGVCNAQTCPFGCCDTNGFCQPGFAPNQCGNFGSQCQDCVQLGEQCSGQQCMSACAQTCQGCCDKLENCQVGFLDNQCGGGGSTCQDCTALAPPSTCDVNVSPPGCASQQTQCPSPYGGCPPFLQEPVLTNQPVCSKTDLQNAAAACSAGANSTGCSSFFQVEMSSNPACANCLQPFDFDFDQNSGVLQCAAPFVDATCNHNSACLLDCANQSCGNCPDSTTTSTCLTQVSTGSGQCSTFYQGDQCVTTALGGKASVCNPATYKGNFGAWLQGVGAQYCGQ